MRIEASSNQVFFDVFPGGPEIINEPNDKKPEVIAQDAGEKKEEANPTIGDFFFHKKGIGQRSDYGHRYYTPDEVQNMSKEELEDEQKKRGQSNAGAKAATTAVDAVGNLLPTDRGAAISGAAGTAMSAAADKLTERADQAPPEKESMEEPGQTRTRPAETDEPKAPEPKERKDKSGLKLNPDYMEPIETDDGSKRTASTPVNPPKPKPIGPVKIKIEVQPARKDAVLKRETDPAGDELERKKYLETKQMQRIY